MATLYAILLIFSALKSSQAGKSILYVQSDAHLHQQDNYDVQIQTTTPKCPYEQRQLTDTHAQQQSGPRMLEEWQFMDSPVKISMEELAAIKFDLDEHQDQHPPEHEMPHEMHLEMPVEVPAEIPIKTTIQHHVPVEKGYRLVNNRFSNLKRDQGPAEVSDWTNSNNNWMEWKKVIAFHRSGQQELLKKRKHHLASKFHIKSNLEVPKPESPLQSYQPAIMSIPQPVVEAKVLSHGQPIKQTIVESPQVPIVVATSTEDSKGNLENDELEQQDKFSVVDSVMSDLSQQPLDSLQSKDILAKQSDHRLAATGKLIQMTDSQVALKASPSAYERVRGSLLNAADIARNLASRASSSMMGSSGRPSASTEAPRLLETNLTSILNTRSATSRSDDRSDNTWQVWQGANAADQFASSPEPQLSPIFLGFGQLQRMDPFNGNGRTQARLSCQFGDERARNMSISQVQWARFVGSYDANEVPPGFNCQASSTDCRLVAVKTDTFTTVHPRPTVQNYINTLVPSYSMTLHEVNPDHLGTYRCSAVRLLDSGRRELVYRVIPLEYS